MQLYSVVHNLPKVNSSRRNAEARSNFGAFTLEGALSLTTGFFGSAGFAVEADHAFQANAVTAAAAQMTFAFVVVSLELISLGDYQLGIFKQCILWGGTGLHSITRWPLEYTGRKVETK